MAKTVNTEQDEDWDFVIQPRQNWFDLALHEIWRYKDLLLLFVRRDFVSVYKQTVLGPLWFFIQPIFTAIIFTFVFGNLAQIPTDGLPKVLFYMAGIVGWNYFADCLNKTSATFTANAGIFGKVYFPRLIVPLSIVISNLIKFGIQFLLFLGFLGFYALNGANIHPNATILLTPVLVAIMAGLGLGFGLIISALTTKYRDLQFLIVFGTQLLMYVTPIVYPMSFLTERYPKYEWVIWYNPMTPIIEAFKHAYLGAGSFDAMHLVYSGGFTCVVVMSGLLLFHKVEKNFMDTV